MTKKRITLTMPTETILAAKALAKDRGITVSQLFVEFVEEMYQDKQPNAETQKAIAEARDLALSGRGKSFSSLKDLSEDLNS